MTLLFFLIVIHFESNHLVIYHFQTATDENLPADEHSDRDLLINSGHVPQRNSNGVLRTTYDACDN